jgi:glycosyltransferase involved in cell wall biosynthesis
MGEGSHYEEGQLFFMKILYDHQTFAIQEYGGISRYFLELMNQFRVKKDLEVSFDAALHYSNNEYLHDYPFLKYQPFLPGTRFRGKGPLLNQINKLYSIPFIFRGNYDLFHPTYYDPYFLKYLKGKPFVITVHDMIHEIFPQYFPRYDRIRAYKRLLARKASHIIAVSGNTRDDLLHFYDIDPGVIEVVYHGNPFHGQEFQHHAQTESHEAYFLFVGNRRKYKNFDFFVSTVSSILTSNPKLKIICAGGGEFTPEEKKFFEKLNIPRQVFQVRASDEDLKQLYSRAIAFVFPSLYEGFGIPVLEAFSCGCPALLSNTSSLPEIGGEAALYFDPSDPDTLYSVIVDLLENEKLREQLVVSGLNRIKNFTWEKTAWGTRAVYQQALE